MLKLANIGLLGKINLLVVVMAAVTIGGAVYSTGKMRSIDNTYGDLLDGYGRANLAMARANRNLVYVDRSLYRLLTESGDGKAAAQQEALDAVGFYQKQIKAAKKALPQMDAAFAPLSKRLDDAMAGPCADVIKPAMSAHAADVATAEAQMRSACDPAINGLMNDISALTNKILKQSDAASDETQATTGRSIRDAYAIILGGLALVFAAALYVARYGISRPLRQIVATLEQLSRGALDLKIPGAERGDEVGMIARAAVRFRDQAAETLKRRQAEAAAAAADLEAISKAERARAAQELAQAVKRLGEGLKDLAAGDLSIHLDKGFSEEYVRLRDDFNEAIGRLNLAVRSVVESAQVIETGVEQISTSAQDLAARSSEQATTVEAAASSLDEVTEAVKRSAEGASHASEIVASADKDARHGVEVMGQAIEAMNAIAKSTGQIGRIIEVMDDITFQTNLLALNAGVEAARTGEAGKGFAVIAAEVRRLAQHSADASRDVKRLIAESSASVDTGAALVSETGEALNRITAKVAEVNQVVAEIAGGARAQAERLSEINAAVGRIDDVTQKNAEMAGESTAASRSLSDRTRALTELVGRFRTQDTANDRYASEAA